jgi:hypothetical protein
MARPSGSKCAPALGLAAALVALLLVPLEAWAAQPVKGSRYAGVGSVGGWFGVADLRVENSGRSFDPRSSIVDNSPRGPCRGFDFRVGTRSRPVRISRSGRFRSVRKRRNFVIRISGRFVTKDRARISFRYRRSPRRRGGRCDDSGLRRIALRRADPVPFRDCHTHKAKTLLMASAGRVFQQREWAGRHGLWVRNTYACLFSVNRRFRLAGEHDHIGPFRLAEPYVAFAQEDYFGIGGAPIVDVQVHDLRDGRARSLPPRNSRSCFGTVTDLALKATGAAAWIADPPGYCLYRFPRSVWADDALGYRQLDGGDIEPRSLELNGSALSWLKDGVVQTAALE